MKNNKRKQKRKKLFTRIISGEKKGLKLISPKDITRPLTDRIKTSLFDMLQPYINKNTTILDLYAGGGNFGIEALSRGVKHCTFVDVANESIKCITENLNKTNYFNKTHIIQANAQDYLRRENKLFDIIFVDPPFNEIVIKHIEDASKLMQKQGLLIFRHPKSFKSPDKLTNARKILTKKYGKSVLSFYYLD